jgi:hypothetical protein
MLSSFDSVVACWIKKSEAWLGGPLWSPVFPLMEVESNTIDTMINKVKGNEV